MADLGTEVDAEDIEGREGVKFKIWNRSAESWRAWMACDTQWNATGAGLAGLVWVGLNYAGVDVVLRRLKFNDAVFPDVMIMEGAALGAFAERPE